MTTDIVVASPDALTPHDLSGAIHLANIMAKARLVPKHLHGDPGTCLMVIEQAMRWHMSPFAVAQCTSSISGKLMFEGKLVAAACQSVGAIEGHFDYTFEGEGDTRSITVSATRSGEKEPKEVTVMLKEVKTSNEWWTKQPDQQLVYSGTRIWARRWTPAAILGVYSPEEFDRFQPGKTIDATAETATVEEPTGTDEARPKSGLMDKSVQETVNQAAATHTSNGNGKKPTIAQWFDHFQADCDAADTVEECEAILKRHEVMNCDTVFKNYPETLEAIQEIKHGMMKRIYQGDDLSEPTPPSHVP